MLLPLRRGSTCGKRRVRPVLPISAAIFTLIALSAVSDRALALCPPVHGDITGDGAVTITDVQCLILAILASSTGTGFPVCVAVPTWQVDLDCSNSVTVTDGLLVIGRALSMPLHPTIDGDSDNCPDSCQPFCGDGVCESSETCGSCPAECGCDDGIECTNDSCTDGVCTHVPDAQMCDDGQPCTKDHCDSDLGCTYGPETDSCLCPQLPPCSGAGCAIDGDGDGVIDPCDLCPVDNPDDANMDGKCDSANTCPCGYVGAPGCSTFGVTVLDPNWTPHLVTGCLPKGSADITYAADGHVYGIRDGATGPTGDEQVYKVNMGTGKVNIVGTLKFTNPASSDLWTIDAGPGGAFTQKLYITDWGSGNPARIDRVHFDLSAPEVIYATTTGSPIHTLTSNVAFATTGLLGGYAYFAGQGGGTVWIARVASPAGSAVQLWKTISGVKDIRALAFGPGGVWGQDLYVATSSVLNGFDNAPGGIYRISPSGVVSVFVPESKGLEFGTNLIFDQHGILGGGLYYTQVDGQLFRISPSGTAVLVAKGIQRSEPTQAADGSFLVSAQRGLFRLSCAPGVCQPVCGDGVCGVDENCANCAGDCACDDSDPCTEVSCTPSGVCVAGPPCPNTNPCVLSECQENIGCVETALVGSPCDDLDVCTAQDSCSAAGVCIGMPTCDDKSACTIDSCAPKSICPNGSIFGTSCYTVGNSSVAPLNWEKAQESCAASGGQLVTITTPQENEFVRQQAEQKCPVAGDRAWIGLTYNDSTQLWGWASGEELTYTNWDEAFGEPNNLATQKWADMTATNGLWRSSEPFLHGNNHCWVCELPLGLPFQCTFVAVFDPQAIAVAEVCNGADDDCDGVVDNDTEAECNDGNPCTLDVCAGIIGCTHSVEDEVCDDGVACTIDSCTPETGCQHEVVDSLCDDGIECTTEACDVASGCTYEAHDDLCDDGQTCSTDVCNLQSGCDYFTDGTCDDGIACTEDVCLVGQGCVFTPDSTMCSDNNPCTDDVCLVESGCVFEVNTAPCDDADLCTEPDVCESGVCVPGTPVVCDDGLACTVDDCNPASGCPSPLQPTFISDCSAPGSLGGYFEGPFSAAGSVNLFLFPDPDWTCKGTLSVTIDLSREPDLLGIGTAYCESHLSVVGLDFNYEYVLPVKVTGNVGGNTIEATVKVDQIILPWTPTIVLNAEGVPVQIVGSSSGTTSTQAILDSVQSSYPANPSSPYSLTCTADRVDIVGQCCNGFGCQTIQDHVCYAQGGDFVAIEAGECCTDDAQGNPQCIKLTQPECKVNGGYFVPAAWGVCCDAPNFCAGCTSAGCESCNWQPCMAISSVLCDYLQGNFKPKFTCADQNFDQFADVCGPPADFGYATSSVCSLSGDTLTVDIGGVAELQLVSIWSQNDLVFTSTSDVSVITPVGPLDFPGVAQFEVSCQSPFSITATADLPPELAGVSAFNGAEIGLDGQTTFPAFSIGYAFGYELVNLGFLPPVGVTRPYFYVHADSGVDFAINDSQGESSVVFKPVEGNTFSMAIDANDPAFSVALDGELLGDATGQLVKGAGFGVSLGGEWMMSSVMPIWNGTTYLPKIQRGHVWRSGEFALIPVPNLPVNLYLEGEVLVDAGEAVGAVVEVAEQLATLASGAVDGQLGDVQNPFEGVEAIAGTSMLGNVNQMHIELVDAFEFAIGKATFSIENGGLAFAGDGFSPGATLASGGAGPLFEAFGAITLQQTGEVKGWVDSYGFEVEIACNLTAGPFQLTGVRLILSSDDGIRIEGGSFGLDFGAFFKALQSLMSCSFSPTGAQCSIAGIPLVNFQGELSDSGFVLSGSAGFPILGQVIFGAMVGGDGQFVLTGTASNGIAALQSGSVSVTIQSSGLAISTAFKQFGQNITVSGSMSYSGHYVLTGTHGYLGPGGYGLSKVSVTVDSNKGISLTGSWGVPMTGSQVKLSGLIPFGGGAWTLYGTQSVTLLGFPLSNAEFWMNSTSGVTCKGKLSFAGVTATMTGWFASSGQFELKAAVNLSPGGFKLSNAMLTLANTGLTMEGNISVLNKSFYAKGAVQNNGDFALKAYGNVSMWVGTIVLGYYYEFPGFGNFPPIIVDDPIWFSKVGTSVTISGNASVNLDGFGGLGGKFSAYSDGSFSCSMKGYAEADIEVDMGLWDVEVGSVEGDVTVSLWNFGASLKFAAKACAYGICSPKIEVGLGTDGEFSFPVPGMGSLSFDLW